MEYSQEQLFHDLEQRYVSLKQERDAIHSENISLKEKVEAKNAQIESIKAHCDALTKENAQKNTIITEREQQHASLLKSQDSLQAKFNSLTQECERYRLDSKIQTDELATMQTKLRDAQAALSEATLAQLPAQFESNKLVRERDLLKSHVADLEKELERVSGDLAEQRRLNAAEADSLRITIRDLQSKATESQSLLQSAQDRANLSEERIDQLLSKLSESEKSFALQQGSFTSEIDGLKRMVDLYKRHLDEATAKIDELEVAGTVARETSTRLVRQATEAAHAMEQQLRSEFELERSNFISKVREQEVKIAELVDRSVTASADHRTMVQDAIHSVSTSTAQSAGPMEMFARIASAESALAAETGRRKETELFLKRIVEEMESKEPIILAQKREYARIIESHDMLTKRANKLAGENAQLRETVSSLEGLRKAAVEEANVCRQQSADLSSQLQHLLKTRFDEQFGGSRLSKPIAIEDSSEQMSASDVIADYLLTFDDIKELQTKNAQLVQVVRKLSQDQEKLLAVNQATDVEPSVDLTAALNAALQELSQMRESRLQTEEMVATLVHQRDMYRTMVTEADQLAKATRRPSGSMPSSPAVGSPLGKSAPATPGTSGATANSELQMLVLRLQEENTSLRARQARLEEADKLFSESLDKIRKESNRLRLESANASSDARFQRERADRLEESLRTMLAQNDSLASRRFDIEKSVGELQQEVRLKEERVGALQSRLRSVDEELRRAKIDVEVHKEAEARLMAQLSEQREEIKKQVAFGDSIRRIEAGLTSRVEEERASLEKERDSLQSTLDTLRRQTASKDVVTDQRILSLTEELKSVRSSLETKLEEVSTLRADIIREQGVAKASQERALVLENQLTLANERLGVVQGQQVSGSALANDLAERDILLAQATSKIETLTAQLTAAEAHAEQYRRIGVSTEAVLDELREKSASVKSAYDEELDKLKASNTAQLAEIQGLRESAMTSVKEVEDVREQLHARVAELNSKLRSLEGELFDAKTKVEANDEHTAQLRSEITKHQTTAKQAHANYERELQLHAAAERVARERDEEIGKLKLALETEKVKATDISASAIRSQTSASDEKMRLETQLQEARQQVNDLRASNDILHSQVNSLSQQMSKTLEGRALVASEIEGAPGTGVALTLSHDAAHLDNEVRELRELVRFMKRERDVLESKLAVTENESSRYQSSYNSNQRVVDELRLEVKRLQEVQSSRTALAPEEITKLKNDSTQLQLVLESNSHLRVELEVERGRIKELSEKLAQEEAGVAPLRAQIRELSASREALEDSNETLLNDCTYWKDRLHQLVSRYNDIDPEEHRLLQVKVDELQKSLASAKASADEQLQILRTEISKLQEDHVAAIAAAKAETEQIAKTTAEQIDIKSKELEAQKGTYQILEENTNQLRNRFRDFKKVADAAQKRALDAEKLVSQLKAELDQVKSSGISIVDPSKIAQAVSTGPATPSTASATPSAATSTTTPQSPAPGSAVAPVTAVPLPASIPAGGAAAAAGRGPRGGRLAKGPRPPPPTPTSAAAVSAVTTTTIATVTTQASAPVTSTTTIPQVQSAPASALAPAPTLAPAPAVKPPLPSGVSPMTTTTVSVPVSTIAPVVEVSVTTSPTARPVSTAATGAARAPRPQGPRGAAGSTGTVRILPSPTPAASSTSASVIVLPTVDISGAFEGEHKSAPVVTAPSSAMTQDNEPTEISGPSVAAQVPAPAPTLQSDREKAIREKLMMMQRRPPTIINVSSQPEPHITPIVAAVQANPLLGAAEPVTQVTDPTSAPVTEIALTGSSEAITDTPEESEQPDAKRIRRSPITTESPVPIPADVVLESSETDTAEMSVQHVDSAVHIQNLGDVFERQVEAEVGTGDGTIGIKRSLDSGENDEDDEPASKLMHVDAEEESAGPIDTAESVEVVETVESESILSTNNQVEETASSNYVTENSQPSHVEADQVDESVMVETDAEEGEVCETSIITPAHDEIVDEQSASESEQIEDKGSVQENDDAGSAADDEVSRSGWGATPVEADLSMCESQDGTISNDFQLTNPTAIASSNVNTRSGSTAPPTSPFLENLRPPSPKSSTPVFGTAGKTITLPVPTIPAATSGQGTPTGSGAVFGFSSASGAASTGIFSLSSASSGSASSAPGLFRALGTPSMFSRPGGASPSTSTTTDLSAQQTTGVGRLGGLIRATSATSLPSAPTLSGTTPKVMGTSIFGNFGGMATSAPSNASSNTAGSGSIFGAAFKPNVNDSSSAATGIFGSTSSQPFSLNNQSFKGFGQLAAAAAAGQSVHESPTNSDAFVTEPGEEYSANNVNETAAAPVVSLAAARTLTVEEQIRRRSLKFGTGSTETSEANPTVAIAPSLTSVPGPAAAPGPGSGVVRGRGKRGGSAGRGGRGRGGQVAGDGQVEEHNPEE